MILSIGVGVAGLSEWVTIEDEANRWRHVLPGEGGGDHPLAFQNGLPNGDARARRRRRAWE
jgi:hypothetical protein